MDYILFGIQGSGKGTQGKILAAKIDAAYFETGGELRRLAAEQSPLGQKVKSIITAGTSCAERSRNGNRGRFYKKIRRRETDYF